MSEVDQCRADELVEVYRAAGEAEAELIKSLLDTYGIPSLLRSNAAPSVHAFAIDGLGEVRVMVPKSQAEEAKSIIRKDKEEDV